MAMFDFWDIFPRVVETKKPFVLRVRNKNEQRAFGKFYAPCGTFSAQWTPAANVKADGEAKGWGEFIAAETVRFAQDDPDTLEIPLQFDHEGEYIIRIRHAATNDPQNPYNVLSFSLYAADADLFALRPFKGDLHIHSSRSACGYKTQDPRFVAAWAIRCGFDFFALTDHVQQKPSLELIPFLANIGTDVKEYPGEELHFLATGHHESLLCHNPSHPQIHIVAIGGKFSVSDLMNDHFEEFNAELDERVKSLPDYAPGAPFMRRLCAASDWLFEKIHEAGGLGIFAHPFWLILSGYNLPTPLCEYIVRSQKWDAWEVFGDGAYPEGQIGNWKTVALWHEACMKLGRNIPVVGNSDSHDAETKLNAHVSIVFAKDNSQEAICDAIKRYDSVTVMMPRDPNDQPAVLGSCRLVEFTYFLMREFYPEHDRSALLEGEAIAQHLAGNLPLAPVQEIAKGRLSALFEKYWNKGA